MTLKDLPIGKTATVTVVGGEGALRQHFLDMGIIPMADVTMVKYAPMGDPVEVRIHSYELTLRLADAAQIQIDNVRDEKEQKRGSRVRAIPHPGLGEGGKYHEKGDSTFNGSSHGADFRQRGCIRGQREQRGACGCDNHSQAAR